MRVRDVWARGGDTEMTYMGQLATISGVGFRGTENVSQPESSGKEMNNRPPYGDAGSSSMRGVMSTI